MMKERDLRLVFLVSFFSLIMILSSGFVSAGFDPDPVCGNGIVEDGEECDDWSNGVDTDQCYDDCNYTYLGDGIMQCPNGHDYCEECDDTDFGIESCQSRGYDLGFLICDGGSIDDSECWNEGCGNGVIDDGEDCDDGNDVDDDDCPSDCTIEIRVYLDPKYIDDTEKNRNFRPDKITPFDDIICEVSKDYAGASGKLMTADDSGNWNVEITSGTFDANGQWKINGWDYDGSNDGMGNPAGWATNYFQYQPEGSSNDGTEGVLEQIITKGKVKCVAEKDGKEIYVTSEELGKDKWASEYSNCLHVWGKDQAEYNFLYLYGLGYDLFETGSVNELTSRFLNLINKGFHKINPFRKYRDSFSYFFDLKPKRESEFGDIDKSKEESLCNAQKNFHSYIFYSVRDSLTAWGVPGLVVMPIRRIGEFMYKPEEVVLLHEVGHAMAGLQDEYVVGSTVAYEDFLRKHNVQCSLNPSIDYSFQSQTYGDINIIGCQYALITDLGNNIYRPSKNSIMRNTSTLDLKFNTISCGFILSKLNKKSPKENWIECFNMGGLEDSSLG